MRIHELFKKMLKTIELRDILVIAGTAMVGRCLYGLHPLTMWGGIGIFFIYLGWPKKAVK